jgi:hypothetical protein
MRRRYAGAERRCRRRARRNEDELGRGVSLMERGKEEGGRRGVGVCMRLHGVVVN